MSKLAKVRINVSKINKDKLYKGEKGVYLDMLVSINNEKDEHGNNIACWQDQTKEEREAQEPKNYLGNGRVIWTDEGGGFETPQQQVEDDIPF